MDSTAGTRLSPGPSPEVGLPGTGVAANRYECLPGKQSELRTQDCLSSALVQALTGKHERCKELVSEVVLAQQVSSPPSGGCTHADFKRMSRKANYSESTQSEL